MERHGDVSVQGQRHRDSTGLCGVSLQAWSQDGGETLSPPYSVAFSSVVLWAQRCISTALMKLKRNSCDKFGTHYVSDPEKPPQPAPLTMPGSPRSDFPCLS